MVKLINHTLKAATIIESIVAMVIITSCLGFATLIYSNVMNSDKQRLEMSAGLLLENVAQQTKKEKSFVDSETQEGIWKIKKTVERYKEAENCYLLQLIARNADGKFIKTRNELIITQE